MTFWQGDMNGHGISRVVGLRKYEALDLDNIFYQENI